MKLLSCECNRTPLMTSQHWFSNGLVPWGSKSLPEPALTEIYDAIGCHQATLTHWGRATHICVGKLTTIGSDNGLSPDRRQAIIRTNAGILLIRHLGTNFSEILIKILLFSFKKMRLKVSSAKRRWFCLGLNVLKVTSGLPTSTEFPYSVRILHAKYGSTNLA